MSLPIYTSTTKEVSSTTTSKWINIWTVMGWRIRGWGRWNSKEEAERVAKEFMQANSHLSESHEYLGAMPESEWIE